MRKIYQYVKIDFFHWLMTSWWRNTSDIFYIFSIPEIFYYHVVTMKSSLVTLVTCTCAVDFWDENCGRRPDFPLPLSGSLTLHMTTGTSKSIVSTRGCNRASGRFGGGAISKWEKMYKKIQSTFDQRLVTFRQISLFYVFLLLPCSKQKIEGAKVFEGHTYN